MSNCAVALDGLIGKLCSAQNLLPRADVEMKKKDANPEPHHFTIDTHIESKARNMSAFVELSSQRPKTMPNAINTNCIEIEHILN